MQRRVDVRDVVADFGEVAAAILKPETPGSSAGVQSLISHQYYAARLLNSHFVVAEARFLPSGMRVYGWPDEYPQRADHKVLERANYTHGQRPFAISRVPARAPALASSVEDARQDQLRLSRNRRELAGSSRVPRRSSPTRTFR